MHTYRLYIYFNIYVIRSIKVLSPFKAGATRNWNRQKNENFQFYFAYFLGRNSRYLLLLNIGTFLHHFINFFLKNQCIQQPVSFQCLIVSKEIRRTCARRQSIRGRGFIRSLYLSLPVGYKIYHKQFTIQAYHYL